MSLADTPHVLAQEMRTCIHFRGIQHERCAAGVELRPLRDTSGSGMARWPCLRILNQRECTTTCSKREFPTEAEARARLDEMEAALSKREAVPDHDLGEES